MWLALAATASAQAAVEYGAAAGASSTAAAAGAKGVGKAIGGIGSSLDKALKGGQPAASAPATVTRTTSPAKSAAPATKTAPAESVAPPPEPKFEDPSGIETGIAYDELVRRFGPPTLEITGEDGKSLEYSGKAGNYHLELKGDSVASVRKPKS